MNPDTFRLVLRVLLCDLIETFALLVAGQKHQGWQTHPTSVTQEEDFKHT